MKKRKTLLLTTLLTLTLTGCNSTQTSVSSMSNSSIEETSTSLQPSSSIETSKSDEQSSSIESSSDILTSSEELSSEVSSSEYLSSSSSQVEYVITFISEYGEVPSPITYRGEPITLPELENYGYKFQGWYDGETKVTSPYTPSSSITLRAKWDKITYVYAYYNGGVEHYKLEYLAGDIFNLSDLTTPESMYVDEVECPFIYWVYEGTEIKVPNQITIGDEDLIFEAKYDMSKVPPKGHFTKNEDGSFTTTGNLAYVLAEKTEDQQAFSLEIKFNKGSKGGAGVAFRMALSGNDYAYEDEGSNYLSAVLIPASGGMQISSVTNGKFAHLSGSVMVLTKLPTAWQEKYNSAVDGSEVSAKMTVIDYGNKFELYIDGALAATYDSSNAGIDLNSYTGTGFGIRSSCKGTTYKVSETDYKKVTFINGDDSYIRYVYVGNELTDITSNSEIKNDGDDNYYYERFIGWQDSDGRLITSVTSDTVVYPKFERVSVYKVTIKFENGQDDSSSFYEYGQQVSLPENPTKQGSETNGVLIGYTFDGWYVGDTKITSDYVINQNTTIIAKYNQSNAYKVFYQSNLEDLSINPSIVADGDTLSPVIPEYNGYRFAGWYTNPELTEEYTTSSVTESFTLYAKWVKQVTITFNVDGNIITRMIDINTAYDDYPVATKETINRPNGNISSFTFDHWEADEEIITTSHVFTSDTLVKAIFKEKVLRNDVEIQDDNSAYGKYVVTGTRAVSQGVTLTNSKTYEDVRMSKGTFSYDLTFKKSSQTYNIRTLIDVEDNDLLPITGAGQQGLIFVNYSTYTGGIILGKKIAGSTNNCYEQYSSKIKSCAYKTKFDNTAVGEEITLNFRIEFTNTYIKYYIDDCLIITYGNPDITGETLYGTAFNLPASPTTHQTALDQWLKSPKDTKLGWQMWQDTTIVGGSFSMSNIKVQPME